MRPFLNLAVLAGLTPLASADFFQIQAEGTFELLEVHPDQINILFDAPIFAQVGGLGLNSVNGEATHQFTFGDPEDVFFGSGQLVGDTPDDILVYMFDAVMFADDANATFAGTWEIGGGFGDFEGFTGSGQLSGFYLFNDDNAGQFGIVFQGDVVPAPATFAMLSIAALIRPRRRRS